VDAEQQRLAEAERQEEERRRAAQKEKGEREARRDQPPGETRLK
jgi:hypothetical protein